MALNRIKTWVSDEELSSSDLNAEFSNILTNALSLISPVTGTLDLNGNELILDADADTSITSSQDDRIDFRIGGTDSMFIGHAAGNTAGFVTVDPLAFTATANTSIARLMVAGTNALTVPAGTTAIAAGLHVAEPNLTATGTITSAVSLYIAAAPTEGGTNNYALWVDDGATQLDGAVVMASTLNVTGAVDVTGTLTIASNIIHQGDTNNLIAFTTDAQSFETGGTSRLDISDTGVRLGAANARVTTVLDEDAMGSDSATALATQQSIKAYADSLVVSISGHVLQVVNTTKKVTQSLSTNLPADDTTPLITEGDLILTRAITPAADANTLKIEISVMVGTTTADAATIALFQGTTMVAAHGANVAANHATSISFVHFISGSVGTSEISFTVRCGGNGQTLDLNGVSGGQLYNSLASSSITISEIKA